MDEFDCLEDKIKPLACTRKGLKTIWLGIELLLIILVGIASGYTFGACALYLLNGSFDGIYLFEDVTF